MKETFGQRFQRLRKSCNMTQEDVAQRINISAQAVSKWENDLSSPDISILSDLADMFHVTLNELLGKEEGKVELLPEGQRKKINDMLIKIHIDSIKGDSIRLKFPISIIKAFLQGNISLPNFKGNDALSGIDFENIFSLVEQGVIGEIMTLRSADGDEIKIFVE